MGQAAYIGDDLNDIPCMNCVKSSGGIVGCPADAVDEVKVLADFVSACNGGNGAVRDFIDKIISDRAEGKEFADE